ncbi:MAG: hypothetical protein A2078_16310 [Nitrospirae bacterium GWC2_57_9]|nr:MAG: hypothetical protein A2078_16310 [Nitrospirae bacterium GWC2_57_9]
MSPLSLTTVFLVLFGALFLAAAIIQGRKIKDSVPSELQTRWLVMVSLMFFFLAGYLFLIIILVTRLPFSIELVAGIVFLGGAFFVYLVISVSRGTISRITSAENDLKLLNEYLERRVAERTSEVEQSRVFLSTVIDSLNDSVMIIRVDDFTVTGANRPFLAEYGLNAGDVIGRKCHQVTHNRSDVCMPPHDTCPLIETAATGRFARAEHIHHGRNGEKKYVEVTTSPIREAGGQISQVVHISRDVTQQRLNEERLRNLALYDMLTGLPNRTLFFDRVRQLLELARRNQFVLAILFIDLDRFKDVNDTLGHDMGDLLLKEVSARLTSCTRKADTVARVGGDEFVGICGKIEAPEDALVVARKIMEALSSPYRLRDRECTIGASIGISIYPQDGDNAETLVNKADAAMYRVKEGRKGGFMLYGDMQK